MSFINSPTSAPSAGALSENSVLSGTDPGSAGGKTFEQFANTFSKASTDAAKASAEGVIPGVAPQFPTNEVGMGAAPQEQSEVMDELSIDRAVEETKKDDKNQFLELMIAQLENQNPLEPQEGGEFLAQLAQFSMVDGIERLNENSQDFYSSFRSGQALQASSLVGRSVGVNTGQINFTGEPIPVDVELSQATSQLNVYIANAAGEQVGQVNLGQQVSGDVPFVWDGTDSAGVALPLGQYQLTATAQTDSGEEQMNTQVAMNVDSVTLDANGAVELNVRGYGPLALNEVRQIR